MIKKKMVENWEGKMKSFRNKKYSNMANTPYHESNQGGRWRLRVLTHRENKGLLKAPRVL
jgi:hypothetical protein